MYDLWYSIGVAVMDPAFIARMQAVPPVFTRVTRVIKENNTIYSTNSTTAGLLQAAPTTAMRSTIAGYLGQNPSAPPVSIHTAGKWCQFLTVGANLMNYLNTSNAAFVQAAGANPPQFSSRFPALLGLCVVDQAFCNLLTGPAANPDLTDVLNEFGIQANPANPDWQTISSFVGNQAFQNARDAALSDNNGCWATGCEEQFVFWAGKNEHAIL